MRLLLILACCLATAAPARAQSSPSLAEVVDRVSRYVAAYGGPASLLVATETYKQRAEFDTRTSARQLKSDIAVIKRGDNWVAYRDVRQVDDKSVAQENTLLGLLSSESVDDAKVKQVADESGRYVMAPINRSFTLPTTVLFFFRPASITRFSFVRKGTRDIDGVQTWELAFEETARPTLVRTRDGRDVPCRGSVWVVPADGSVVRTRLDLRGFAEQKTADTAPPATPPDPPKSCMDTETYNTPVEKNTNRVESVAVIEVTYRLDSQLGAWLPWRMSESYEGPMPGRDGQDSFGRTTGAAEYSGFKRLDRPTVATTR